MSLIRGLWPPGTKRIWASVRFESRKRRPSPIFLADDSGAILLEIYCNPPDQLPDYRSMDPLLLHVAFVSADPDSDKAALVAAGADVVEDKPLEDGSRVIMLRDPWDSLCSCANAQSRCCADSREGALGAQASRLLLGRRASRKRLERFQHRGEAFGGIRADQVLLASGRDQSDTAVASKEEGRHAPARRIPQPPKSAIARTGGRSPLRSRRLAV